MEILNIQTRCSEVVTVVILLALSCTSKLFLAGLPLIIALEIMNEINSHTDDSQQV